MVSAILILLYCCAAKAALDDADKKNDANVEEYQEMSWRVMATYNQISDDLYYWIPIKLLDVRTEFTVGLRFTIRIAVAQSNCTRLVGTFLRLVMLKRIKFGPENTSNFK
ncbi:unnamed protein product [Gongylonema pulchrum]|uniref:Cystatin domain-containing protein n=1 Tax=Gongylonema pulchrum TaxID=637853 RepID=A0A183ELB4_9BILA|nr:unnamed protein product [Gongylonema pulchrum]